MKQQRFVFIIFLILAVVTMLIVTTTTPTPRSFKPRSNKKMATKASVQKVQKQKQLEPVQAEELCYHDGIRYILLGYASGHKKNVTKADMISLQSRLQVKLGNVETSIRSGKFDLGNSRYVQLQCGDFWLEEVKDFIPEGEEVPRNLR
jgi:Na+-transporting methylmalonyl-CoA/oxaloacetate decarboxylase gamma subunit